MREYQSGEIKDLLVALNKCQGELELVKKDSDNPFFNSKYADLAAVINAAKEPLEKNGLSILQFTDILETGVTILITQLNHVSGQWIRGYYPLIPVKADPQGLGSAYTYARRYNLSAMIGLAAEDDDGNAASQKKVISAFQSEELRDKFRINFINSINNCETVEQAKSLQELNKAKFDEIKNGNNADEKNMRNELIILLKNKANELKGQNDE